MSDWTIEFAQQPVSYFRRLNKEQQDRISEKLLAACADPVEKSERLVNRGGQRRIRVGNLRILFDISEEHRKLMVTAILPRGDVYKHTKK